MTTKEYISLEDIPQGVIDLEDNELTLLHFNAVLSKMTGKVLTSAHDALAVRGSEELYCPNCAGWNDEYYVTTATEVRVTWFDPETFECEAEEVGKEFCTECHGDSLWEDAEAYGVDAKSDYDSERWRKDGEY